MNKSTVSYDKFCTLLAKFSRIIKNSSCNLRRTILQKFMILESDFKKNLIARINESTEI